MTTTVSRINNIILCWLPAIAWMMLIFWFSSQPDLPRPASNFLNLVLRKSAHFGVYAVLALCYLYAIQRTRKLQRHTPGTYALALLLAVLYAVSDEYHQSWTPNRRPAVTDVLIDTAGAITALALWRQFGHLLQRFFHQYYSTTDNDFPR